MKFFDAKLIQIATQDGVEDDYAKAKEAKEAAELRDGVYQIVHRHESAAHARGMRQLCEEAGVPVPFWVEAFEKQR